MKFLSKTLNNYKLKKRFPAWHSFNKLLEKLDFNGRREVEEYLLSHPDDTIVYSKIKKNENQYKDLLIILDKSNIKKSKENLFKYQEIQELIYPILTNIEDCISEITKSEERKLRKISEEYGKELSQRLRLEQ